ncbi:MAG: Sec-independent protein translocase subunit TatA/TatB [Methylocystis sp.]
MFDLDPGKLLVIGIVALIAIPSKDLPRVLRTLGQVTGRMRRMAAEFQDQFMEAMREAEIADLKKEIEETNKAIMDSGKLGGAFDPMTEARKQIVGAIEGKTHAEEAEKTPSRGMGEGASVASSVETASSPPPQEEGEGKGESGASSEKAEK